MWNANVIYIFIFEKISQITYVSKFSSRFSQQNGARESGGFHAYSILIEITVSENSMLIAIMKLNRRFSNVLCVPLLEGTERYKVLLSAALNTATLNCQTRLDPISNEDNNVQFQ